MDKIEHIGGIACLCAGGVAIFGLVLTASLLFMIPIIFGFYVGTTFIDLGEPT